MKLETFDDVAASIRKNGDRKFHLLAGNGLSMAYDSTMFSYDAFHNFVRNLNNPLLTKLFEIVKTTNFELVMRQLDSFSALLEAFGSDKELKGKVDEANVKLKQSLVEAIQSLHPEHVFEIPEARSTACAKFLSTFLQTGGSIFTTNYDLLLYWILLRNNVENHVDGFGRDRIDGGDEFTPAEERVWSELRWGINKDGQNVCYLHGALPLFDDGAEVIKEEYDKQNFLLEKVRKRIAGNQYPIFVTSGDHREKLTHIRHQ